MANIVVASSRRGSTVSAMVAFRTLAGTRIQRKMMIGVMAVLAAPAFTQDSPANAPGAAPIVQAAVLSNSVTVPPGTEIPLVLTHPVQSRMVRHGDDIYAQTTAPIAVGNAVVIPAGTFVQGKLDKFGRNGSRGEMQLQSLALIFPDGYSAPIPGPLVLQSDAGYALKDPGSKGSAAAIFAPLGGAGAGALIGHFAANASPQTITSTLPPGCMGPPPGCLSSSVTAPGSSAKGTVIGAGVGGMVGAVVSIVFLVHGHNFYLDAGAPMETSLQQPLVLKENEVEAAVAQSAEHSLPPQPIAPRPYVYYPPVSDPGTCYTPGSPGTPDTVIPGMPASDTSPGTPPTVIPGIPPTPPIPHPCP